MQLPLFDEIAPGEFTIPQGERLAKCRSCQASIIWTKTAQGKPIPLDLASARTLGNGQRVAVNHFATCPEGKDWSRRK